MAWMDEIKSDDVAHLYFRDLDIKEVYVFTIYDFWHPEEIQGRSDSHADYLVFEAETMKKYPQNSLDEGSRVKFHVPKICFSNSLKRLISGKGVVMRKKDCAKIKVQKQNKKRIEILDFQILKT